MRWAEISIDARPQSADAAANVLLSNGCAGASEASEGQGKGEVTHVIGYLPVDDILESRLLEIRQAVRLLPSFGFPLASKDVTIHWVDDEDWAEAWKKYFKPFSVGRIVVKPTWEEYEPAEGELIVELDPGMAFGTGSHPTTQLCLTILQSTIKGGETVLDVGTGSGILAIAAARLGAGKVVGVDNDPVAVRIARENMDALSLGNTISISQADSPDELDMTADVVVANILAGVIIDMADALLAKMKPGGLLLTSGIIEDRAGEVDAALQKLGLQQQEILHQGEWVAMIHRRPDKD